MNKLLFKLPEWWKAETPVLARFFQLISLSFEEFGPCQKQAGLDNEYYNKNGLYVSHGEN